MIHTLLDVGAMRILPAAFYQLISLQDSQHDVRGQPGRHAAYPGNVRRVHRLAEKNKRHFRRLRGTTEGGSVRFGSLV